MKFFDISITTNTLGAEAVSDMLLISGITSFSISDPHDFIEIVEEKSVPFDYYESNLIPEDKDKVTVNVYLAETEQGTVQKETALAGLKELKKSGLPYGELSASVSETDDKEWEDNWKQYFHPLKIGDKFIIRPSWETCVPDGRYVLEIDPESSFGTGQHETTRLCLEMLEKLDVSGKDILDMGCGSGILGIGACLMGAESVTAVDIDENAVRITEKNARVNGLPDGRLAAYTGNILADAPLLEKITSKKYAVILANIVADVLVEMLGIFRSCLTEGGYVILSGIIDQRKEKVIKALTEGFVTEEIREENDWVAVKAIKA